jgi:hypothetical protein
MRKCVVAVAVSAALAGATLAAQGPVPKRAEAGKYTPPRTADGHPDFSGVWANNFITPTERPKEWAGKDRLTDAELDQLKRDVASVYDKEGDAIFQNLVEAALAKRKLGSYDPSTGNYNEFWMAEREIDHRTSLVTDPPDGRIPAMTTAGKERLAKLYATFQGENGPAGVANGPEDRPLTERCITFGAPRLQAGYDSYFQFVQSKTTVGILQETIHDVRIIPLDGKHPPASVRQWLGDSRGRWEGDTLVVETTNYSPEGSIMLNGATGELKVTERFTRVSPDYINWEMTFNDPQTWTRPWTMMIRLKKDPKPIYEYACHEANIAMTGILAGARAKERAGAKAGKKTGDNK